MQDALHAGRSLARALADPYAEKPAPWKGIVIGLFIAAGLLLAGISFLVR